MIFQPIHDERIGDPFVDNDAIRSNYRFARVYERAEYLAANGGIKIPIIEHTQRRIAAKFKHRRLPMAHKLAAMILLTRVDPVKTPHAKLRIDSLTGKSREGTSQHIDYFFLLLRR